MNRKYLNFAMIGVAAALGAGVYFAAQKKVEPPKPPLTALNTATIHTITIENKGKTLKLERTQHGWRFTAPFQAAANDANVASILSVAVSPCERALKPQDVKLPELGLDPPHYSVTFDTEKVAIGATEPLKYRRYALVDGRICLISNPSAPGLGSEDYANLVSTQLVPADRKLVKIQIPGYTATFDAGAKTWSLSPAGTDLAQDAALKLADAWQGVHALWNALASDADTHGQDVTLGFSDGSTVRFTIAAHKPQLKLVRADLGIAYAVSPAEGDKLLKPAPAQKKAEPAAKTASKDATQPD